MYTDKTWNYVRRTDDISNAVLWERNNELSKIYTLFVTEAYSVSQVARMMDKDVMIIILLIEGVRRRYKIGLIQRIMRRFNFIEKISFYKFIKKIKIES